MGVLFIYPEFYVFILTLNYRIVFIKFETVSGEKKVKNMATFSFLGT